MADAGIYAIESPSGKRYIGSAVNLARRRRGHFQALRKNSHPNALLQAAFNKYGEAALSFLVLERCETSALLEREQVHIDAHDFAQLYNIRRIAASNLGVKFSEETRRKVSAALRGRPVTDYMRETVRAIHSGKKLSEATRARISASKRGIGHPHTNESRNKIAAANRRRVLSAETRDKIANARRGQEASEATRAKLSAMRTSSGFTGVSFDKGSNKWMAYARHLGKRKYLGLFSTVEIANEFRDLFISMQVRA